MGEGFHHVDQVDIAGGQILLEAFYAALLCEAVPGEAQPREGVGLVEAVVGGSMTHTKYGSANPSMCKEKCLPCALGSSQDPKSAQALTFGRGEQTYGGQAPI